MATTTGMIEVIANDRLGTKGPFSNLVSYTYIHTSTYRESIGLPFLLGFSFKVRVKCSKEDTVGDLKKLIAAQTGTRFEKIRLKRANREFKNHITLYDYEINDGTCLDLY
ncbi:hypothetical protein PGT21_050088 [Puccinia graminis f. sp. tritici]|uniref:Ubiquitin-like modifier HUB1 n=1 Tax=Puccinia graminis f. sp. tritici TaxID=56615 RepID=A0A5B0MUP5_PUCGR|nr:hypothetical protein PGT21_050088 [Puccinia graminis f. sp. tritici]